MGWDLPSVPGTGTIATVANWAQKVIDCLRYLKGLDGVITLSDGLDLGANELTVNSIEVIGADGEVNAAALESHGAAQHTNITRELFISSACDTDSLTTDTFGITLLDNALTGVTYTFKIPADFVSTAHIYGVYRPSDAGDMYWRMAVFNAANGEIFSGDTGDYGTDTVSSITVGVFEAPDIPTSIAAMTIGDYVYVKIERDATHASDTVSTGVTLLGILFTYTANQ